VSQQINLYNPDFERKRDLLSLPGAVSAWGVSALIVAVVVVAMSVRTGNLEHNLAEATAERDSAQAETNRFAGQLASRKPNFELAQQVARLEVELASRKEVVSTLGTGVIGNTRGFSGYLSAFARQSFSGIWLTGLRVAAAGKDVVLEGRAVRPELVPNYLQRLNREDVMQGHAFAELEIRRPEATDKIQGQARFVEFRLATLPGSDTTSPVERR
jgi:hypothetical protein